MADQAQDNPTPTPTTNDIESQIKSAINSRSSYFQEQADSLTFEKVRRLLEKDLGLETHALDTHKRFVKKSLQTCIESATSDNLSKNQDEAGENVVSSTDEPQPVDDLQVKNEAEEANAGGVQTMEDSPVMGLMTGPKKAKPNVDAESKLVPDEITIKKAIWARASYLRENSENITLVSLRRLLEEDLAFEKHTLDPFKKFIGQEVDELLNLSDVPQSTESEKKKNPKKNSSRKVSSNSRKEKTADSSGNNSDEVEEEEVKVRKRSATKRKPQKNESVKKRKKTEEDTKGAKSDEEEGRNVSDNDNSDSSAEKTKKKKEVPKPPSYGKQVERLKSVIKSCGMSISPAIYRKVKQAPENKRESCLMKELEEMLAREGLSTNPSEKEIKDVKKRKEKAKELEGIDLSNIVSSGRRRSTTSFIPPPKPEISDLSESESEESEDDDDEDEDEEEVEEGEEGDEEAENVEADEDQENGGNDSQGVASDKGDEKAENMEADEDQENGDNDSQGVASDKGDEEAENMEADEDQENGGNDSLGVTSDKGDEEAENMGADEDQENGGNNSQAVASEKGKSDSD